MRAIALRVAGVLFALVAALGAGGCEAIFGIGDLPNGCPATLGGTCTPLSGVAIPPSGAPACASNGSMCTPRDTTAFQASFSGPSTVARLGQCTPDQIAGFYAACLDPSAAPDACSSWTASASNSSCLSCLQTDVSAPALGATVVNGAIVTINAAACIATVEPCNRPCAAALFALYACENVACDPRSSGNCPVTDASSAAAYKSCAMQAASATSPSCSCSDYGAAASCVDALTGPEHPAAQQCGLSLSLQEQYTAVATVLCGPC